MPDQIEARIAEIRRRYSSETFAPDIHWLIEQIREARLELSIQRRECAAARQNAAIAIGELQGQLKRLREDAASAFAIGTVVVE